MAAAERATGKTTAEIFKMMEQGQLASKDFLVPFAKALREMVRENNALQKATEKLTSQQNRLNTAYKELVNEVFQEGGASSLGNMFKSVTVAIADNKDEIKAAISIVVDLTASLVQLGTALGKVAIGVLDVFGKLVSFGTARNGVSYLVGIFYDLVAVIYKASAGVQFLGDLLKGDFKDAMKYLRGAEMAVIQGEQTAFDRLTAPILQARQKAEASTPVKIDKIEYNSYNSDPKQSMIEFDRYLENNLSNLLAYKG